MLETNSRIVQETHDGRPLSQVHRWGDTQALGRGINSIQMVRKDGRWWITSIICDEETGAGPAPAKYLPAKR